MAKVSIEESTLYAIGDAIREKGGTTAGLNPEGEMPAAIRAIQSGGDLPRIVVNTLAGISVTATQGNESVEGTSNSSGVCILEIPSFGDWNVTVTNGSTTNSVLVNVPQDQEITVNFNVNVSYTKTGSGNPISTVRYYLPGQTNGTYMNLGTSVAIPIGSSITVTAAVRVTSSSGYVYGTINFNGKRVAYSNASQTSQPTYTFTVTDPVTIVVYENQSWLPDYTYYVSTSIVDITMSPTVSAAAFMNMVEEVM